MAGAANLGGKADIAANGKVLFDENLDAGDDVQILLLDQAFRQTQAAPDAPIQWHVAEPEAADAISKLLQNNGYDQIEVIHTPQTTGK
jgi:hypothetical protein